MSQTKKPNQNLLALGCVIMAAITLLSVNVLSDTLFQGSKIDLTEERLYTLSAGTHEVLEGIDEPINVKLYFSTDLGEAVPTFQRYFERVRSLLEQYADISGGKINLEVFDPEAFSDAEDRAVAAGLTAIPLGDDGVNGYFGYSATNSTDNQQVQAFIPLERERFLEYDFTKLVYSLANPEKQAIAVVSGLPLVGAYDMQSGQQPDWQIIAQLREFYDVRAVNAQSAEIPDDISILIIAQPVGLSESLLYSIDQFAIGGGRVIVFADPNVEIGQGQVPGFIGGVQEYGFERLLNAWGVEMAENTVVADIDFARRVQFGSASNPVVVDYVGWLAVDATGLDADSVSADGIELLNLHTAGAVDPIEGAATEFTPLISSSLRAMRMEAEQFALGPNPLTLLEQYVDGEATIALAARVVGNVSSAFPDGRPIAEGEEEEEADPDAPEHLASGRINAVVFGDVDFLYDSLWMRVQNFLGQDVIVPLANNGDFFLNVVDNLSGGEALINLRGRGVQSRPFHLVEEIQEAADLQYRAREEDLNAELEQVQADLRDLQRTDDGGTVILTSDQEEAIENFRTQLLTVRGELREVKRALRSDIDKLEFWLKFANIAAIPLLVAFLGLCVFGVRRARQSAAKTAI